MAAISADDRVIYDQDVSDCAACQGMDEDDTEACSDHDLNDPDVAKHYGGIYNRTPASEAR